MEQEQEQEQEKEKEKEKELLGWAVSAMALGASASRNRRQHYRQPHRIGRTKQAREVSTNDCPVLCPLVPLDCSAQNRIFEALRDWLHKS